MKNGSQATTFEPYGDKNKWYIEKLTDKVRILPSMVFRTQNTLTNSKELRIKKGLINCMIGNIGLYCNTFSKVSNTWGNDTIGIFGNSSNIYQEVAFRVPVNEDANYFNTIVTYLYMQLATPICEEITDKNLINQLEAVQLQKGENNVSVSGDLPMILDLSKYIQIAENHL